MSYLNRDILSEDAITLSRKLLGKILVHRINGKLIKGKIVETEAYIGLIDKACHAYGGKRTQRTETLYGPPGIAYVYSIYGMYHCFNVIVNKKDLAEGVLIRAIEPLEGLDIMSLNRYKTTYSNLTKTQIKNLANGPGKLCIAMQINKEQNTLELIPKNNLYIENADDIPTDKLVETTRIGIDYAEEAKDFLWRFYIKDSKFISKK